MKSLVPLILIYVSVLIYLFVRYMLNGTQDVKKPEQFRFCADFTVKPLSSK